MGGSWGPRVFVPWYTIVLADYGILPGTRYVYTIAYYLALVHDYRRPY